MQGSRIEAARRVEHYITRLYEHRQTNSQQTNNKGLARHGTTTPQPVGKRDSARQFVKVITWQHTTATQPT